MKFILSFLLAFSSTAFAKNKIDPMKAYSQVKDAQAVLIDVREKDEVKEGMIQKALWFPLSKIKSDPDWKEKIQAQVNEKKIYLYCASGRRSEQVLGILKKENMKSTNLGGYESLKKILPITKP